MSEKNRVSAEQFVRTWTECESPTQVSEKLGLKLTSVLARASKFRSSGIPLKNMRRVGGGAKLNVEKINAVLAEITGQTVEEIQASGNKLVAAVAERAAKRETAA